MSVQRHWLIVLAFSVLTCSALAGCAQTQAESAVAPISEETAAEDTVGERLIAAPPAGWSLDFATKTPGLRIAEYSRDEEDAEQWTHKIKFESLTGDPLPEPIEFLKSFGEQQKETCPELEDYNTFSGIENGYPTAVHLFVCRRNKLSEISLVTLVKAIQGRDVFYVITRAQRAAPLAANKPALPEEEIGGWSIYLKSILVCDTEDPEHPCP